MRKPVVVILVILLVVICGGGGFFVNQFQKQQAEAQKRSAGEVRVERGDLALTVIDTGTLDAFRAVDIKSRVGGRIERLLTDEGDIVAEGQLVAIVDPQETQLQVDQLSAQVRSAQLGAERTSIEIEQRRVTAKAALEQAEARLAQLELEAKNQPTLTNANVRAAELALNTARKERERLTTTAHPNARVAAESAVREAEASYDNAKLNLERQQNLLERQFVAQRVVDDARLQLRLAEARLTSARDSLSRIDAVQRLELERVDDQIRQAETDLQRANTNRFVDTVKQREIESARAQVETARAGLRDVETMAKSRGQSLASVQQLSASLADGRRQLSETSIRSPMSGVVTRRYVEIGELVAALSGFSQGTPIYRVEDRSSLLVKLSINEIDVAKLTLGMPVTVEVDAFPNERIEGRVTKIAPASTTVGTQQVGADAVVKYSVEVTLNKPDDRLKSGMSARCTMRVEERKNVLRVPIEYLGKDDEGEYVLVKNATTKKNDKVRVKTGLRTGAFIEVVSGVEEGTVIEKPEFTGPARAGAFVGGGSQPDDEE